MKKPDKVPEAVEKSLEKWVKFHKVTPDVNWDYLNGCYWFVHAGMYHGVELDGYIHT